jgi:hypothetical protein
MNYSRAGGCSFVTDSERDVQFEACMTQPHRPRTALGGARAKSGPLSRNHGPRIGNRTCVRFALAIVRTALPGWNPFTAHAVEVRTPLTGMPHVRTRVDKTPPDRRERSADGVPTRVALVGWGCAGRLPPSGQPSRQRPGSARARDKAPLDRREGPAAAVPSARCLIETV